ncbi:FMN-binding protein [Desulfonatronovibrio hydrogenovorans]|uniref:FMN-binding protein n=1 Tax=Desulfonatronovibrio hydrogenovorans TaxID=53245 RepID=UPI00068A1286|nr:FMN-binding protein [Desulfonatronovibrio hydrogenovorans]
MNKNSTSYTVFFITTLTLVFGTGVSLVHHLTKDMLAENELLHHNRVLAKAFSLEVSGPAASDYIQAVESGLNVQTQSLENREWTVYIPRDEEQHLIGFKFQGRGVWDVITGILVLDKDLEHIRTLEFLEQHETPGLGARIEEEWFKAEFQGLRIAWDKPLHQRIIIGPSPDPDPVNQVDAITGATQTSTALMESLNRELDGFKRLTRETGFLD